MRGGGKLQPLRAQLTATDATNAGDGEPPPRRARGDRIYFLFFFNGGTCPHWPKTKTSSGPRGALPSPHHALHHAGRGRGVPLRRARRCGLPPPLPPGPPPAGPSPGPGPGPGPAPQPYPPPRFAARRPAGRGSAGGGRRRNRRTPRTARPSASSCGSPPPGRGWGRSHRSRRPPRRLTRAPTRARRGRRGAELGEGGGRAAGPRPGGPAAEAVTDHGPQGQALQAGRLRSVRAPRAGRPACGCRAGTDARRPVGAGAGSTRLPWRRTPTGSTVGGGGTSADWGTATRTTSSCRGRSRRWRASR